MPRRAFAAALACAACVALGACDASTIAGGDDSGTKTGKAAAATVRQFALASGPQACDLMTPNALRNVYGGEQANGTGPADINGPPPPYALAACRKAAAQFSGQKVGIDKVDLIGDRAVSVQASVTQKDSERLFDVTLRRKGTQWLIDEIREK